MTLLIDLLAGLLWVGVAIAFVIAVYAVGRRLFPAGLSEPDEQGHIYSTSVRDLASATGLRIATFYGIIIALVYAHELGEYQEVRTGLGAEAAAIADVFYDAGRYGGDLVMPVQQGMATYVRFVVDREWRLLATEQRLSNRAWAARDVAYEAVLNAEPATGRQAALRDHMLAQLRVITQFRHQRQEVAAKDFGLIFWVPAIAGLILVTLPFHVFPPGRITHGMLACFGAFSGIILYFVQAFATPFSAPVQITPGAFERLLEGDMGATPVLPSAEIEARAGRYAGAGGTP